MHEVISEPGHNKHLPSLYTEDLPCYLIFTHKSGYENGTTMMLRSACDFFSDSHFCLRLPSTSGNRVFAIADLRASHSYLRRKASVLLQNLRFTELHASLQVKACNCFYKALIESMPGAEKQGQCWHTWLEIHLELLNCFNWNRCDTSKNHGELKHLVDTLQKLHFASPEQARREIRYQKDTPQQALGKKDFTRRFGRCAAFLWEVFCSEQELSPMDFEQAGFPSLRQEPDDLLPAAFACQWPLPLSCRLLPQSLTHLFFESLKKIKSHVSQHFFQDSKKEQLHIGVRDFQISLHESKKEIFKCTLSLNTGIFENNKYTQKIIQHEISKALFQAHLEESMGEITEIDSVQVTPLHFARKFISFETELFSEKNSQEAPMNQQEIATHLACEEDRAVLFDEKKQIGKGFLRPVTLLKKQEEINISRLNATLQSILFSETESEKDYYIFKLGHPQELLLWVSSPAQERTRDTLQRSFILEGVFS